ncbi:tRNA 2-thiouridine synthesizing protein A [Gammaproteobacteria bacterium]
MPHHFLDIRHLLCPMPIIHVQNRIANLESGEVLELVATDPGVLMDIPTWVRINGHRLLASQHEAGEIRMIIEVVNHPQQQNQSITPP